MKKCLIVDDVEVTRFSTSQFLKELGVESFAVSDSAQALANLRQAKYDAIFLDWHIGKESGIDLLKQIRVEFGKSVPVVVCSGIEKQGAAPVAVNAGASAFLEKPTTKDKLSHCLKQLGIL